MGDGNILSAACRCYNLQINIYRECTAKPAVVNDERSATSDFEKEINIAVVRTNNHLAVIK